MLAKELKIKTIRRQGKFIKKQLCMAADIRQDGEMSYRYKGYVYPEVRKYFEDEGFVITCINSELLLANTNGLPVYVFTPRDDIKLSEEEMKEAENYVPKEQRNESDEELSDFVRRLFQEY